MHYLNAVYAQRFNTRYGRVGHLFQGRFKSILVQEGPHLAATVRYIVRNPVRAGICSTPAEWRWSSHRAMLGLARPGPLQRERVLVLLSANRSRAHQLYRELTEEDAPATATHPLIAGEDEFVRDHLAKIVPSSEHPRRLIAPPAPGLPELLGNAPTRVDLWAARRNGYSLAAIAAHLGVHKSTISRRLKSATIET
jgi:hypothetical protein